MLSSHWGREAIIARVDRANTLAAMLAIALTVGACGSATGDAVVSADDIQGYWLLDFWRNGEVEYNIGYGSTYSVTQPWIYFGETLEGSGGCNRFTQGGAGYRLVDGALIPGEIVFDTVLCGSSLDDPMMASELAMQEFLWGDVEEGFAVELSRSGSMFWRADDKSMVFRPVDSEPG